MIGQEDPQLAQQYDRITQILQQQSAPQINSAMPNANSQMAELGALSSGNGAQGYVQNIRQQQQDQLSSQADLLKVVQDRIDQGDKEAAAVQDKLKLFTGNDPNGMSSFYDWAQAHPDNINSQNLMSYAGRWARETGYSSPDLTMAKQKQQLELQKTGAEINKINAEAKNGGAGHTPASIVLANEMAKARDDGDMQRYNDLLIASKSLEKGQTINSAGGIENMQGVENAIQGQSFSKGFGKAKGTELGTKAANLAENTAMLPQLEDTVSKLHDLGQKATYTVAGKSLNAVRRQVGLPVGEGATSRAEYIAMVDNQILPMLRQTFGAAFTQKEGESLKVTLGDPDKSPEEKDAVLRSFIETKKANIETEKRLMNQQGQPSIEETKTLNGVNYHKVNGQWMQE